MTVTASAHVDPLHRWSVRHGSDALAASPAVFVGPPGVHALSVYFTGRTDEEAAGVLRAVADQLDPPGPAFGFEGTITEVRV